MKLRLLLITLVGLAVGAFVQDSRDPATKQLETFLKTNTKPIGQLAGNTGYPVESQDANFTLNDNLLRNEYFMESMTHFVRERIPERVVHAKGAGAFGYFEVTQDITNICKAKFLNKVGKKTPIAVRFSTVGGNVGSDDSARDPRGFAIKFYTEEGNFDIAGLDLPMFAIKDPIFFPTFIHTQKRNPQTNLQDKNMFWDFLTERPETLHFFLHVLSSRGIPYGYRHMPGFSIHTYDVINEAGDHHYVRFHFTPEAGVRNITTAEARNRTSQDLDWNTRDLYNAIATENFPTWTTALQILTEADVKNATFDVFDPTRTLPLDIYPLHQFGKFVLNRNPRNFFAEMEQAAFCPANLVPGILGGVDRLFEARTLAYRDSQLYRLGANFNKIPVNCPLSTPLTYLHDGAGPVNENENETPNYFPNSFHGPGTYVEKKKPKILQITQDDSKNFDQARKLYENELTTIEKAALVQNIVDSLSQAAPFLRERAVQWYTIIHPDLGKNIATALKL